MLTTTRRDRRIRRQALFTLESLDDRLVLSRPSGAAPPPEAAGAASTSHAALVAQRHEAKLARIQARHEAKLARIEARHEAKLAALAAAHPTLSAPSAIPVTAAAAATASVPASDPPSTAGSSSSSSSGMAVTVTRVSSVNALPVTPAPTPIPVSSPSPSPTPIAVPSPSPSPTPSPVPLPANVGAALQSLYTEFEKAGNGTFTPDQPSDKLLQISGNNVEVTLKIGSGTDFNTALSQLQSDGMQVTSSSSTYGLIDGMMPISGLPAAAQLASSVNPVPPLQSR